MNFWPVKLFRPTAFLCISLLLILLLLPDSSLVLGGKGHGKKKITPVKHLFGVGIGYQRVVHYKPVLVFSKHRRPKKKRRRPGWGWGGGGGGGGHGKTGWQPVVVQHHIYKDDGHGHGHSQGHHRHGGGSGWQHQHHHHHHHSEPPKRRNKSQYPHRPHRHGGAQSYRGWGWRSTTGPARRNPEAKTGGYHDGFDFPHHSPPRHSYNHQPPTSDDDYGSPIAEWSPGYSHYGNPGLDYVDGDDAGGYETEIKEHWNKHNDRPLTPLVFPGSTVDSPSSSQQQSNPPEPQSHIPPPYPFEDAPKSDTSVTNIRRDFLKNHLKNFREFKGYEDAHRNNDVPGGNQMMAPPGPHYSTTNMQGPQGAPPDQYYDDYFIQNDNNAPMSQHNGPDERERRPQQNNSPPPPDNYNYDVLDDDGFNWSELNRKMSANTQSTAAPTPAPLVAQSQNIIYGVQGALPSTQNNVVVNAPVQANMQVNTTPMPMPNTRERFKPSQRIDDMGSGDTFNDPGFFPTFDQFRKIRME